MNKLQHDKSCINGTVQYNDHTVFSSIG